MARWFAWVTVRPICHCPKSTRLGDWMFVERGSGSIDLKAGGLMFVSVLCYSSLSLAIALTHGGESPYLFATWL